MVLRASSLVLCLLLTAAAAAADINRIVLRVNDQIATLYEFEQRRQTRVREIQRANLPPERRQRLLAEVGVQTMREMYEEMLVLSRGEQLELRISEREVDAAVADTRSSFQIDSDEEFLAALAGAGMTLEDLRAQMRRNLLIREVMGREVQQKISLDEEDLRRYYRNHPDEFSTPRRLEVREVVVPDSAAADPAARYEIAAEVADALRAGIEGEERLAELAAAGRAGSVVELGWVERGDLEPALESVIWVLGAGELSEPVAARGGLHVVQVLAEEPASLRDFAEVQAEIQAKLRGQRFQEKMTGFLEELERNSYVVSDPPPEAAGFLAAKVPEEAAELDALALDPGSGAAGQVDGEPPAEAPETPETSETPETPETPDPG